VRPLRWNRRDGLT